MNLTFYFVHPNGQQSVSLQVPIDWTAGQVIGYLQQNDFLPAGHWQLVLDGAALAPDLPMGELAEYEGATLAIKTATATRVQFEGKGKTSVLRSTLDQYPSPAATPPAEEESAGLVLKILRRLFS